MVTSPLCPPNDPPKSGLLPSCGMLFKSGMLPSCGMLLKSGMLSAVIVLAVSPAFSTIR